MCNCGKKKLPTGHQIDTGYQTASTLSLLHEPFEYVSKLVSGDGLFLDLGAGNGQVLEIATFYFEDMDIQGIEIDPELASQDSRIILGNMFNFKDLIHEAKVIYMYEPFEPKYIDTMLEVVMPQTKVEKYVIFNSVSYTYKGKDEVIKKFFDPRDVRWKEDIIVIKYNPI